MAFPMNDVMELISNQERARGLMIDGVMPPTLCPSGYEDFFRALGFELDTVRAANICLVELSGGFSVSFTLKNEKGEIAHSRVVYDPSLIDETLTKGYRRRGASKWLA
jgi:hypothetical protein